MPAAPFDITSWYWSVADSSPGGQVFYSATGAFVALTDATYVAWLAQGNAPTYAPTLTGLYSAIADYAAAQTRPSFLNIVSATDYQLSNPIPYTIVVNFTTAGKSLILPQTNLPTSIPLGQTVLVFSNTSNAFAILDYTRGLVQNLNVNDTVITYNTINTSTNGAWRQADIMSLPSAFAAGNIMIDQGTYWQTETMSGDVTMDASGVTTTAAWLHTTPTPVSSGGSITSGSSILHRRKLGKSVEFSGSITITTAGTASGALKLPLPETPAVSGAMNGFNATDGTALLTYVDGVNAFLWLYGAAFGTAFNGNGKVYYFGGSYEST